MRASKFLRWYGLDTTPETDYAGTNTNREDTP